MKEKILIIGATGNVGLSLLKFINTNKYDVYLAVRDVDKSKNKLKRNDLFYYKFDFETKEGFDFKEDFDYIFLLRPPQTGNVKKYIFPLLEQIKTKNIKTIFLSVYGADKKSYIPHNHIENKIKELNIEYVFLRPTYFMENLTTTLYYEIEKNKRIYLPSGKLKFNWIAIDDIAEFTVKLFDDFEKYKNTSFELSSQNNYSFAEIIEIINETSKTNLKYISPLLFNYIIYELKKGTKIIYILVMLLLHYFPKFEKEPLYESDFERIIGKEPISIKTFAEINKDYFKNN